jgi:hypothetical protein
MKNTRGPRPDGNQMRKASPPSSLDVIIEET